MQDYNRRHRARELPALPDDSEMWVTSSNRPVPGRVITPVETPRSYLVETPSGQIRRNQQHLNIVPKSSVSTLPDNTPAKSRIMTRSPTGTEMVALKRYQT